MASSLAVGAIVCVLVLALYWAYKKFRGPAYTPGMIAKLAQNVQFDDPILYSKSQANSWIMPNDMELFFFTPSNRSLSSADNVTPTVAVHGGPGIAPDKTWSLLDEVIPDFYLYHARGCGKSTRPFENFPTPGKMWPGIKLLEETLGIGQQVADIERIRRRLTETSSLSTQINLVGHSYGGFIATMYACEFPQHVRSLVLLEPAAVMKIPGPPEHDLFQIVRSRLSGKELQEYDEWHKGFMDFGNLPNETETSLAQKQLEFAKHYDRAAATEIVSLPPMPPIPSNMIGGLAVYATFVSMGMEHDYFPVCKKMLQDSVFPVTIVHGRQDMAPESVSRQYAELFPNVSYKIIENADHFLYRHPDIVNIVQESLSVK
jgi:proline iminopeptidase